MIWLHRTNTTATTAAAATTTTTYYYYSFLLRPQFLNPASARLTKATPGAASEAIKSIIPDTMEDVAAEAEAAASLGIGGPLSKAAQVRLASRSLSLFARFLCFQTVLALNEH